MNVASLPRMYRGTGGVCPQVRGKIDHRRGWTSHRRGLRDHPRGWTSHTRGWTSPRRGLMDRTRGWMSGVTVYGISEVIIW